MASDLYFGSDKESRHTSQMALDHTRHMTAGSATYVLLSAASLPATDSTQAQTLHRCMTYIESQTTMVVG